MGRKAGRRAKFGRRGRTAHPEPAPEPEAHPDEDVAVADENALDEPVEGTEAGDDGVERSVVRVGVKLPLEGSLGEEKLAVLLCLCGHHVGHDQHHHGEQVEPLVVLPLFQHGLQAISHVPRRD